MKAILCCFSMFFLLEYDFISKVDSVLSRSTYPLHIINYYTYYTIVRISIERITLT